MLTNGASLDDGVTRFISQADKTGNGSLSFDDIVAYFTQRGVAMEPNHTFVKEFIEEIA